MLIITPMFEFFGFLEFGSQIHVFGLDFGFEFSVFGLEI